MEDGGRGGKKVEEGRTGKIGKKERRRRYEEGVREEGGRR